MNAVVIFLLQFLIQVVVSTSVSTSTINGQTITYLDNKKVDLSKAEILEKTDLCTVYKPAENKSCTLVKCVHGATSVKCGGSSSVSSSGNMTPEEVDDFNRLSNKY
uniref:Heteropteran venom family 8 protein 1 n=1 Tax=Oncocephalus sp. TaxID=2944721 RepID=A0AB38ZEN9_9HEMI